MSNSFPVFAGFQNKQLVPWHPPKVANEIFYSIIINPWMQA